MASENKLQDIIRTSLENIKNIVDTNTVVGDPITLDNGTTLIPVSKVSVGFASGGVDFTSKKAAPDALQNFGGGGGTGITVSPIGFLVVSKEGSASILNVGSNFPSDPVEQVATILDRTPDILARLKAVFAKEKAKAEKEDTKETK